MSSYEGIPQELRDLPSWVCHRAGEKTPIDPKTGRNAKSNDPETWGTFEQATDWAARNGGGIGFEFSEEAPFCGIDLDHVRDADTGELVVPWAREVVDALDTYTEVSPSGTGLHLIARARKPGDGSKRANPDGTAFEMYDHGRYFRMTGEVFEGHGAIGDRQGAVSEAHARWIGRPRDAGRGDALEWGGEAVAATGAPGSVTASLSAEEAMERMRRSGKWPEISRLWDGDTSGCGGDNSAADMALCNHLAYFCDRDEAAMDELFRRADVISLHCPLFPATQGIINKKSIARMKDGVIIINTSRGPLIVEQDLRDALESGKVRAAAMDVVSTEPIRGDNPLLGAENCIITPHIAWAPKETRQRLMGIAVDNVKAFLDGSPKNVVNP